MRISLRTIIHGAIIGIVVLTIVPILFLVKKETHQAIFQSDDKIKSILTEARKGYPPVK